MFPTIFSTLFSMACISHHFGLIQADGINIEFPPGRMNNYGLLLVFHSESEEYIPVCADQIILWSDEEPITVRAATVACMQAGYKYGWTEQYSRSFESAAYEYLLCGEEDTALQDCSYPFLASDDKTCTVYAGVYCFDTVNSDNYTTLSGTIQSPGYPINYPNAAGFTYIIEMPEVTTITITFITFALGEYDILYYGTGSEPKRSGLAESQLVESMPDPLVLSTKAFWFRFASDLDGTDTGFSVEWNDATLSTVTSDDNEISASSSSPSSQSRTGSEPKRSELVEIVLMESLPDPLVLSTKDADFSVEWNDNILSRSLSTSEFTISPARSTPEFKTGGVPVTKSIAVGIVAGASVGAVLFLVLIVVLLLYLCKIRKSVPSENREDIDLDAYEIPPTLSDQTPDNQNVSNSADMTDNETYTGLDASTIQPESVYQGVMNQDPDLVKAADNYQSLDAASRLSTAEYQGIYHDVEMGVQNDPDVIYHDYMDPVAASAQNHSTVPVPPTVIGIDNANGLYVNVKDATNNRKT